MKKQEKCIDPNIRSNADKNKGFDLFQTLKQTADQVGRFSSAAADNIGQTVGQSVNALTKSAQDLTVKNTQQVIKAIDQNGDGKIDLEDVIILGLKAPGVRIDRAVFLQHELTGKLPQEVINTAIAQNPMKANIPSALIDKIADDVINYERNCVSGISALLGAPGGLAMAATIPTDIIQYYGYVLRAMQKLVYLYGFPAIDIDENGQIFDSGTMNILILCFGTMFGVAGANRMLQKVATALGNGVEKQLLRRALTKGTIYPVVKSVAKWFNVKMTKEVFAGFFKKSIPLLGGLVGGTMTYLSFKPCCDKLKSSLKDTILSNPNYKPEPDEGLDKEEEFKESSTIADI